MDSVLFQNVKIIDPGSSHNGKVVDVLVEDGQIKEIASANSIKFNGSIAKGGMLSPGWIDMRTHLTDPGQEHREDLKSLSAAAIKGGFTRILGMPNTQPSLDNAGQVQAILNRAENLPIFLHVAGALSENVNGKDLAELFDMHQSGALAFTDGKKGTNSAGLLLRGLQYLQPFGGLLISSPIDQEIAAEHVVGESLTAVQMGMKGIPKHAETMRIERELSTLRYSGGQLHIGPVTTKAGLDLLLSAKAEGLALSIETSALYLLLDDSSNLEFDPVTKVYPPLREKSDVEALRQALVQGKIDVVSSSHHPQGPEEKTHDFYDAAFGASNLETAFSAILTAISDLPHEIDAIVDAIVSGPRTVLKLPKASIEIGNTAEITHFDPFQKWTPNKADIFSKSKYNPLIGKELQGKVLGVYVKGKFHQN